MRTNQRTRPPRRRDGYVRCLRSAIGRRDPAAGGRCAEGDCGVEGLLSFWPHPTRGEMFIDQVARHLRLRSEERTGSGVVRLYLDSAPQNGVGIFVLLLDL